MEDPQSQHAPRRERSRGQDTNERLKLYFLFTVYKHSNQINSMYNMTFVEFKDSSSTVTFIIILIFVYLIKTGIMNE